jgi:hypothetical protein
VDKLQEVFRTSNQHDQDRTLLYHIIVKMPRIQNNGRTLKASGEKLTYLQRPAYQNYIRPFSRNPKIQVNVK